MSTKNALEERHILLSTASRCRHYYRKKRRYYRGLVAFYKAELVNRLRYGAASPLKYQLIYCDPLAIKTFHRFVTVLPDPISLIPHDKIIHPRKIAPVWRQVVAPGDWDQAIVPLLENRTIQRVERKLATGCSWEETGEIDRMMEAIRYRGHIDHYKARGDLRTRYAAMDALIESVRVTGRLKEQREINKRAFREMGGIGICIARDGSFIKSSHGLHRLAIARFFKVPAIPVYVEAVHEACVTSGRFAEIAQRSEELRNRMLRRAGDRSLSLHSVRGTAQAGLEGS